MSSLIGGNSLIGGCVITYKYKIPFFSRHLCLDSSSICCSSLVVHRFITFFTLFSGSTPQRFLYSFNWFCLYVVVLDFVSNLQLFPYKPAWWSSRYFITSGMLTLTWNPGWFEEQILIFCSIFFAQTPHANAVSISILVSSMVVILTSYNSILFCSTIS